MKSSTKKSEIFNLKFRNIQIPLPRASDASSIREIKYLFAISINSVILAGIPYWCTIIIAFGLFPYLILSAIKYSSISGSIFHVSGSESINIGTAPRYKIGFTVAEKVKDDAITSSPDPYQVLLVINE